MSLIFSLLFWLIALAGGLLLVSLVLWRRFQVDPGASAIFFTRTEDGCRVALRRYSPPQKAIGTVLLIPPLGFSATIYDLTDQSLGPWLARYGYDVWLLDLRGRGLSSRPRLWGTMRADWGFEDYVRLDMKAALAELGRHTSGRAVHLVGFGMGATVAIASAVDSEGDDSSEGSRPAVAGSAPIKSIVALAGSASFARQADFLPPWAVRLMRWVPVEIAARLAIPLGCTYQPWPVKLLQSATNIDAAVYRRLLANAVFRCSKREIDQFAGWLAKREFAAFAAKSEGKGSLGRVRKPIIFISGPQDRLAPPVAAQETVDALENAPEKQLITAASQQGFSCSYGHLDLVLGRAAAADIYPCILEWLDRHSSIASQENRPRPPEKLLREYEGEEAPTNFLSDGERALLRERGADPAWTKKSAADLAHDESCEAPTIGRSRRDD